MEQALAELIHNIHYNYVYRSRSGEQQKDEFLKNLRIHKGKKYYKIISGSSVWGFVVAVDSDPKFKRGDILKPASWNSPTRNHARGNILEGGYPCSWTGPAYMR